MATASDILLELIKPLRPLFRPKPDLDDDATVSAFAFALKKYSVEEIKRAAEHIAENPPGRYFPTIEDIHQAVATTRPSPVTVLPPAVDWNTRILRHPLALQAAREGWLTRMIAFAYEHDRIPDDDDQAKLRSQWRPFLESVRDVGRGQMSTGPNLMMLAKAMLEKGTRLSRSIGVFDSAYERALARFHVFSETKKTPVIAEEGLSQSGA